MTSTHPHVLGPRRTYSATTNPSPPNGSAIPGGGTAGDLTGDGTHTYQWNAEGRLKTVDNGNTATYTYNALGWRVEKKVGSAYTEVLYDQSGESLGENNRTPWTQRYVNFAGQNNATYFPHVNALGSTTSVTDYTGAVVEDKLFYPWGQNWQAVGTLYEERFAKLQHRDSETSLDPTPNRMFSSQEGRWLSPDPLFGNVSNPQSLNRYAYVTNNPTTLTDPSGLQGSDAGDPCSDPSYATTHAECGPTTQAGCNADRADLIELRLELRSQRPRPLVPCLRKALAAFKQCAVGSAGKVCIGAILGAISVCQFAPGSLPCDLGVVGAGATCTVAAGVCGAKAGAELLDCLVSGGAL